MCILQQATLSHNQHRRQFQSGKKILQDVLTGERQDSRPRPLVYVSSHIHHANKHTQRLLSTNSFKKNCTTLLQQPSTSTGTRRRNRDGSILTLRTKRDARSTGCKAVTVTVPHMPRTYTTTFKSLCTATKPSATPS